MRVERTGCEIRNGTVESRSNGFVSRFAIIAGRPPQSGAVSACDQTVDYTVGSRILRFQNCPGTCIMKSAAVFARLSLAAVFALTIPAILTAQDSPDHPEQALLDSYQFRQIGPFRGGRSAAVCGASGQPDEVLTWGLPAVVSGGRTTPVPHARNISDGFFGGSIGAVEVAPSNPNIIYVGGGEVTVRGNVSHGYGMWKSYDAGKTWTQIGLTDSRRIPRVRVHPHDPDTVWVAALGHLYGPNNERGVYKTTDGGKTWRQVLFVDEEVGACDLVVDPGNPRVLYASMWENPENALLS